MRWSGVATCFNYNAQLLIEIDVKLIDSRSIFASTTPISKFLDSSNLIWMQCAKFNVFQFESIHMIDCGFDCEMTFPVPLQP